MKCPRSAPTELRTGALLVCGMFSKPSPVPACGDVVGGSWASLAGGGSLSELDLVGGDTGPNRCPTPLAREARLFGGAEIAQLWWRRAPIAPLWTESDSLLSESPIPFPLVRALRELRATGDQLGFRCWARHIFPPQHRPQLLKALLAQAMLHVAALLRGNLGRYTCVL